MCSPFPHVPVAVYPRPSPALRCHVVEEPLLVFGDPLALARVLLLPFPAVSVRTPSTFDDPAKTLYNVCAWTCQQYEPGVLALEARGEVTRTGGVRDGGNRQTPDP